MRFYCPTEIHFGQNELQQLQPGGGVTLVLLSRSMAPEYKDEIVTQLQRGGGRVVVMERGGGEPSSDEVDICAATMDGAINNIFAAGGGSTLDFAKALALVKVSGGAIADYEFGSRSFNGALPLTLMPTTCGSGSEVTQYAVINNSVSGRKFTLGHECLRAKRAYLIPEILQTLPMNQILATALDGFIHALEALLNEVHNPIVEPVGIEAMRLIHRHLMTIVHGDYGAEQLEALALASLYGGICISSSRTGLIHTLSVAFSEFHKLSHGVVNAQLLPHAVRFNRDHYKGRLKQIVSDFSAQPFKSDHDAAQYLSLWVASLLPADIAPLNKSITTDEIDHIVARVMQDRGLPLVNSRPFDHGDIRALVEEIIHE